MQYLFKYFTANTFKCLSRIGSIVIYEIFSHNISICNDELKETM